MDMIGLCTFFAVKEEGRGLFNKGISKVRSAISSYRRRYCDEKRRIFLGLFFTVALSLQQASAVSLDLLPASQMVVLY
jgi:hypothetical protein